MKDFFSVIHHKVAYKVLNKRTNRVEESVHVIFDEGNNSIEENSEDDQNEIGMTNPSEPKINEPDPTFPQKTPVTEDENTTESGPPSSENTHENQPHSWKHQSSHPIQNILTPLDSGIHTRSKLRNMCAFSAYVSLIEPKNIKEALLYPDWITAMQEELNQFERSRVWNLVPRPQNKTVIGTRWVFRNKLDEHGHVTRNKRQTSRAWI